MDSERGSRVDLGTEIDDDEDHGKFLYPGHIDVKIIPQMRKCDLLHFKNRFNAAEEGIYAVDVLETDHALEKEEMQEERRIRQSLPKNSAKPKSKAFAAHYEAAAQRPFNIHIETIPKHPHQTFRGQVRFTDSDSISYNPVDIIQGHARVLGAAKDTSDVRSALQPLIYFQPKVLE